MAKYFISHSSADKEFVEKHILDPLKSFEIQYWYSDEMIKTTSEWNNSIRDGLHSCDGLILIMSPSSAASVYVRAELGWAIDHRPGKIIPIYYKECNAEDFNIVLPQIQQLKFDGSNNDGRNKLIKYLLAVEYQTPGRVSAINGIWKGDVNQKHYVDGASLVFPVQLSLKVNDKNGFNGSVKIVLPERGDVIFTVTGGFLYERFVQFSYYSADANVVQFGSAILELDEVADKMVGKFIGYGAVTKDIVDGDVDVTKQS